MKIKFFKNHHPNGGGAEVFALLRRRWVSDTDKAKANVDAIAQKALVKGVKTQAVTSRSDVVSNAIIAAAKKYSCDLLVMASHGRRGITRLLLGSETQQVLTHASTAVLVVR
jgi:nucleotide-binding universal stress UspA family protein